MPKQNAQNKGTQRPALLPWALGYCALLLGTAALVYGWRVFYSFSRVGAVPLTLCAFGVATLLFLAVMACRVLPSFAGKGAVCILACGLVFCFANPPLQTPDETSHYLRSYSISQGHFDFDGTRSYPTDVAELVQAFPGAWVSAHTSQGLTTDTEGHEITYNTQGYALKQYGADGAVQGVWDGFAQYFAKDGAEAVTEPIVVQFIPFLPQALGMALARLLGLGALGCLYGGRIANLCVYALLCWRALKNCRRYQPVFLAVMLLPLSLYMAASLSYDALLLGCYYLVASYYCKDEITTRDLVWFLVAFALMNAAKPYINLLWLALPLILPRRAWQTRVKKWQLALAALALAGAVTLFTDWYGVAMRTGYTGTAFDRPLGEGVVNQLGQLSFVLRYPLRYLAVMAGTLYENGFYIGQLGVFGALDMPIELVNLFSPAVLVFAAALSVHEKSGLRRLPAWGLGGLSVLYIAGAMTAMYITYTPVGMVRIIGLQARYFLPAFLMLFVLLAALLSRVLAPTLPDAGGARALETARRVSFAFAALGGVLLFQHYFVGPVFTIV